LKPFLAIHYALLVTGSLATGLPALCKAFPEPASPYILGAAAVCALLTTVLGAVSPAAAGGDK
jgi:hypothetical protein